MSPAEPVRRSLPRRVASRLRRELRNRRAQPVRGWAVAAPAVPVGDVPIEPTCLGPVMDARVALAKAHLRPPGKNSDYDLVRDHFDVLHYLLQNPAVAEISSADLVQHFLDEGAALLRSPSPDFSMELYLARHPRARRSKNPYADWLRRGRSEGKLGDPAPGIRQLAPQLGMEESELVERLRERRHDLLDRLRTGTLGEMFAKAAQVEPLVGEAWSEISRPVLFPFSRPVVADQTAALYAAQESAGFRRARVVIVVNRARWGGGRRMEGHLAHALTGQLAPDDIVVIYTDAPGERPAGRFPPGVREIDFVGITKGMDPEAQQPALVTLLRSFGADAIVNINSRTLYLAMRSYGRALAASERVFLCFFCNEQNAIGMWQGWSLRYFYRTFETVAGVITDSRAMADDLCATYRLTGGARDRVHVFSAPVDSSLPVVDTPPAPGKRPQVFWAGRWDRQKRIGLLLDIARRMPDVDFRMWGERVMGQDSGMLPANVLAQGLYGHISEIPLAEADVWLYTSGWDGVPSQLLEVAMTGVPMVATLVGGTGEVLPDDGAWPIPLEAGAEAYEAAIRAVLADPQEARRRALSLRERLLGERTLEAYAETAAETLLTDPGAAR
jgi:glycosyltransferase involved in cell wall biosynthesis